jgi:hypothetical protein
MRRAIDARCSSTGSPSSFSIRASRQSNRAVAALAENGRAEAKKLRDRLRAMTWLPKRKSPAAAKAS